MKNLNVKSQSGFTLVETIVVAILTTILALGAYSVFMMYINETREITARIRLQTQYETLTDEIARTVRSGNAVRVNAEGNTITITGENDDGDDETEVVFSFAGGTVQVQRDDENELRPFVVANNLIYVNEEESAFIVEQSGTRLITNLTLLNDDSDNPRYTLTVNGGVYSCRN